MNTAASTAITSVPVSWMSSWHSSRKTPLDNPEWLDRRHKTHITTKKHRTLPKALNADPIKELEGLYIFENLKTLWWKWEPEVVRTHICTDLLAQYYQVHPPNYQKTTNSLYFIRGVGFASLMESVLVVQVQADSRDVSVGQLTSAL
jgi:hypothetical protein